MPNLFLHCIERVIFFWLFILFVLNIEKKKMNLCTHCVYYAADRKLLTTTEGGWIQQSFDGITTENPPETLSIAMQTLTEQCLCLLWF